MLYRTKLAQVYCDELCRRYAKAALEEAVAQPRTTAQPPPAVRLEPDLNESSYSLITSANERKRLVGTPKGRPAHRQDALGKKLSRLAIR